MISAVVSLSSILIQKEMQLNQLKHKQLLPQPISATLTYDNQNKLVHYSVKIETVRPSQKDDCRPFLGDFENGLFSFRKIDKRENIQNKPLDSFSFEALKPIQSQNKKLVRKNTKTFLQQSANLTDTDITVNPIRREYRRIMICFPFNYH